MQFVDNQVLCCGVLQMFFLCMQMENLVLNLNLLLFCETKKH